MHPSSVLFRRSAALSLQVAASLAFAVTVPGTFAQVSVEEAWFQSYNTGPGPSLDRVVGVVVDPLGDVIVTGQLHDVDRFDRYMSDFYTVKYSGRDGRVLWQRRFSEAPGGFEYPTAIAVDDRGNIVVTGNGNGGYTAKYAAADGAVMWEQFVWDGSVHLEAMALDGNGDVAVAGNGFAAKYAGRNGRLLWQRYFIGETVAVATDARGNVVVAGGREDGTVGSDYYTAKLSAKDGAILWERLYDGLGHGYDLAAAVTVDKNGNVVVTGESDGADMSTFFTRDYYTAKYAAKDGTILWEQRYNGPDGMHDYARSIAVDRDDNVVVTGDSYAGSFPHYYTVKYAASNGALLWDNFFDGPDNRGGDVGTLAIDRLGNVVISGAVYNGVTSPGFYTAMYAAANGSLSWEKYFFGPGTWKDVRISNHSLALGPDGMIVVAGISAFQYSLDYDFATVAYRVENPSKPHGNK